MSHRIRSKRGWVEMMRNESVEYAEKFIVRVGI
jgi:hypothetical protein